MDFIFLLIPSVAIACYCVLLLILFNYRKDKINKIFIWFVLVNLVWCTASLLMRLQVAPSMTFYNRILVSGMILAPLILLSVFVSKQVRQGKRNIHSVLWIIVGTSLLFLGCACNLLPTIGKYPVDIATSTVCAMMTAIVIENARMCEQAKLEAITDGLTKLYNHRYFTNMLHQFVTQGMNRFVLMIFDLDHFKLYNDLHGHYDGDRVLEQTAKTIRLHVGEKGTGYRYGGEEFTILLPDASGEEGMVVAEKIRLDIEKLAVNKGDKRQTFLTISAGIAEYPQNGITSDQLLKCADLALYLAKRDGKNKCVLYGKQQVNGIQTEMENELNEEQMNANYTSAVYALAATIQAKDQYTFSHSQNVSRYGAALARVVGLDSNHVEMVRQAGMLHDIGKIGIPETILLKDSPLSAQEYEIIKGHVDITIRIIKHIPSLNRLVPCVLYHHERWDGKGYPRGIAGDEIPVEARCLTVADAFDAMTNDRPYRKAMSIDKALVEIEKGKGAQFDPTLAQLFINHIANAVSQRSEGKRLSELLN